MGTGSATGNKKIKNDVKKEYSFIGNDTGTISGTIPVIYYAANHKLEQLHCVSFNYSIK